MPTHRRQLRKRQTRRRHVSRKQAGGGKAEDFLIIQSIYRHIGDEAELIAAIYTTPAMYAKIPEYPVESPIGKGVIPDRYARPSPGKKPLNSAIKGAYNFFHPYAGKYRGSESEHAEYEMAVKINNKLQWAFVSFMNTNPRILMNRGEEHSIPPSRGAVERANKLFSKISRHIEVASRPSAAEMEGEARERRERARAAEQMEREYERHQRAAAAAAAGPSGGAGRATGPAAGLLSNLNSRLYPGNNLAERPLLSEKEGYLVKKGPVEFW